MYWEDAKVKCASMAKDSSLAKITTKEENDFVIGQYFNNKKYHERTAKKSIFA